MFNGHGRLECIDGRVYTGQWRDGKKHGEGHYYYLRDGDIGDLKRHAIGGKDSMYRVKEYSGGWEENTRYGEGIITYVNGDKVEGTFVKGQPHGVCQYHFAGTDEKKPRMRYAEYCRGERVKFMDQALQAAKDRVLRTMKWMAHEQEVAKVMEENPEY